LIDNGAQIEIGTFGSRREKQAV